MSPGDLRLALALNLAAALVLEQVLGTDPGQLLDRAPLDLAIGRALALALDSAQDQGLAQDLAQGLELALDLAPLLDRAVGSGPQVVLPAADSASI